MPCPYIHDMANMKEGAVLVVGGGIGGIQTALDLADSGFYVYLAEERSAIGGRMAQLDKTFPTNDCAMCMLSPKLVEAGRHHNIKILPDTELLNLEGPPGNFVARLRRKPRYVDMERCIGCGECAKVCPIVIPNEFDGGIGRRRAAYRLYPQAIPAAYAIEKRGISPCRNACPAGTRAQGYIALVREGRYEEALRVIKEENPFPGICGRICNHPCESACNRGLVDQPVAIKDLKRFIVDQVYRQPRKPIAPIPRTRKERVAIVGSGPCGLTAAQDLVKLGYGVTVFEALPVAGGMLRVGVPEYRLPSWIIEREVQEIIELGVELRLNTGVDNLEDLFSQGFNAVLIAVGAHEGKKLPIPGADLKGVLINTVFLRDVRLGKPPQLGDRVLVLGGGNVAFDVARTAVRLGAKEVHLACLESREKMPAFPDEIEYAEEEGVILHPGRAFQRITDDGTGHAASVECLTVKSMEFDSEGRLTTETILGTEHLIPADTVIFSIGQAAGLALIPQDAGIGTTWRGTIAVNPNTLAATRPGVFAGGDSVTGTAFVIEAVAAGHRAAASIDRYLRGDELEPKLKRELPVIRLSRAEIERKLALGEVSRQPRVVVPTLSPEERKQGFVEVEQGYTEELARAEAARCLQCGLCSECLSCLYACKAGAIDHDMMERVDELTVGAVVLAPGFEPYDARLSGEYGFGRHANVLTSIQFERLLSASGPTLGRVLRPSDQESPKKLAFIQCVGSRDLRRTIAGPFCSAVCCMAATKEALVAKEHDQAIEPTIFYIDLRAYGKGFAQLVERAQGQGVRYVRSMISQLVEMPETKNLLIRYRDEPGQLCEEEFDLVVLSVGLRPSSKGRVLAEQLGIALNEHGFAKTEAAHPVATSRAGVFATGAFTGPKDIPETVIQASAAAAAVGELLASARGTRIHEKRYPAEAAVDGGPRIGVFVCHCGSNIAGVVDVQAVADYARTLPGVVGAENVLYTCSQDNLKHMKELIQAKHLNRIVVASCTPRNLEGLFQDTIREAGLNKFLFEMVNIREQCSWVHSDQPERATDKAKALVRMGVAKARQLRPLALQSVKMTPGALVLGGGLSGMTAALTLAAGGFETFLIERAHELGSELKAVYRTLEGEDVQQLRADLIARISSQPKVHVCTGATLKEVSGAVGNFSTIVSTSQGEEQINHGIVVVASEAEAYRPNEYLYGQDERVLTQRELERLLHQEPEALTAMKTIVMIQCVGRDEKRPDCSRTCCGEALKNALMLKEQAPERRVYVLFREMMSYGFSEDLYRRARERGVVFIRHDEAELPRVERKDGRMVVTVSDARLRREVLIEPDLLVLSTGLIPDPGNEELGRQLKVPIDAHGFFVEAHIKLRPVDFASQGIFLCGASHAPGTIPELIAKALAAAGRAATVLSKEYLEAGGAIAVVDREECTACLTCLRECPYGAIFINSEGLAEVAALKCQGCGICAADCPAKAIQLRQFEDAQELSMLRELLAGAAT